MIDVAILGLSDGMHDVNITVPATTIPDLSEEFVGSVDVRGSLRKVGKRFFIDVHATGHVLLVCDRSGEEFDDTVEADIDLEFIYDNQLANAQMGMVESLDESEVRGIYEDAKVISITDDVRQELMVHLPLRRVAPKYRDATLDEIFPETPSFDAESSLKGTIDERWSALKNLSSPSDETQPD